MTDTLTELQRPFAANSIKWKVTSQWPKDNPRNGLLVAYVDARTVAARLDHVCKMDWSTRIERDPNEVGVVTCYLTVQGTTRADVGKGSGIEKEKAGASDALKRAAVLFGVSRFIYAMQAVTLKATESGELDGDKPTLRIKSSGNKKSLVLTAQVENWLRQGYEKWLASDRNRWGEALDHGDELGAVGDPVERGEPTEQADLALVAAKQEADGFYKGQNGKVRQKVKPGMFAAQLDAASSVADVDKLVERVREAAK